MAKKQTRNPPRKSQGEPSPEMAARLRAVEEASAAMARGLDVLEVKVSALEIGLMDRLSEKASKADVDDIRYKLRSKSNTSALRSIGSRLDSLFQRLNITDQQELVDVPGNPTTASFRRSLIKAMVDVVYEEPVAMTDSEIDRHFAGITLYLKAPGRKFTSHFAKDFVDCVVLHMALGKDTQGVEA